MIKESLVQRGYRVFLDYDEIKDGMFDKSILDAIDSAPVYMLILTAHCLDRCSHSDDWVRQELEHALERKKKIVPVNPDKQFAGFPDTFPDHLKQGLKLHQYSTLDTGQLYQASIEQLDRQRIRPYVKNRRWMWLAFPLLIVFALGGFILYQYQHSDAEGYYQSALRYNDLGSATYNSDSATYWFTLSARAGYAPAMRELARLCQLRGDERLAYEWCLKAYNGGDTAAVAMLGLFNEEGYGTVKDVAAAIDLYRKGADMGSKEALYRLGLCLRDGVGLKQDYVEGMKLIVQSGVEPVDGRWVFDPPCERMKKGAVQENDLPPDLGAELLAVHLTDTATSVYFRWHNKRYFGGWMQICPKAFINDVKTAIKYHLKAVSGCRLAPDTTSVPFGTSHDFTLIFAPLPAGVETVDIIESDTSRWQWFNVKLTE